MTERRPRNACPHLGLFDERGLYCLFASPSHRCYQAVKPKAIPADQQELLCLKTSFRTCPRLIPQPKTAKSSKRPAFRTRLRLLLAAIVLMLIAGVVGFIVIPSYDQPAHAGGVGQHSGSWSTWSA